MSLRSKAQHSNCRPPSNRHGSVATEVALCVPLLLLLALGAADFGRIAHSYQVVCNAARVGAERGAMQSVTPYSYPVWEEQVRQAVLEEISHLPDFDPAQLTCVVQAITDGEGLNRTTVTVSYPFHTVVRWPLVPDTVPMERTVEFRQFR
jgi:Flp pilus assembly protein TadG